jgi:uridine kinase
MTKRVIELFENVDYPYTCAIVNNQRMGFLDEVEEPKSAELLSVEWGEGRRTYERTLTFLALIAVKKINQNFKIIIKHSLGDALYGEIIGSFEEGAVSKIKENILSLINENKNISKIELTKETAIQRLERENRFDDINVLKYLSKDTITLYHLNGSFVYFAGPLLPRTGMAKVFDIVPYSKGFLILLPKKDNFKEISEVPKVGRLFEAIDESEIWLKKLEISNVGEINKSIINGKISNIIKIQEALHEKKISDIADMISKSNARLILIAGPSSSGKTTFAKKLEIQLRVNGLKPFIISTDNYFIDRDKTPKLEDGTIDYDCFDAINHTLLKSQLEKLLKGEEVEIPKYNFPTGRGEHWRKLRLDNKGILIVEGIHSLNPALTSNIKEENKFKIYVSALTQINIDNINRIPTRDTRLIRRIVRDNHFRGISASDTIKNWPTVIKAEEKYIFPYQENANVMFNSTLVYELAVLRNYAEVPLRAIDYKEKEYGEALRLLNFLSHILPLMTEEVPPTSILREFIGKSSFKY